MLKSQHMTKKAVSVFKTLYILRFFRLLYNLRRLRHVQILLSFLPFQIIFRFVVLWYYYTCSSAESTEILVSKPVPLSLRDNPAFISTIYKVAETEPTIFAPIYQQLPKETLTNQKADEALLKHKKEMFLAQNGVPVTIAAENVSVVALNNESYCSMPFFSYGKICDFSTTEVKMKKKITVQIKTFCEV